MKKKFAILMSCLVFTTIVFPYFCDPASTLLLSGYFVSAVLLFLQSCWMLAFFHDNYGKIPREIQFYLGLCLVVSSAFMFGNFDETARSMVHWEVSFRQEFPHLSVFLIQFIRSINNIFALGFAAFGASVAANAISHTGK